MAGVWLVTLLFLYFSKNFANADECVAYNFEYDIDNHFFNDTGICGGGLQGMTVWGWRTYEEVGDWIGSFDEKSVRCIQATSTLSCGSTFVFPMAAGGVVEINVYMHSNYFSDQITAMVMQQVPEGTDLTVANVFKSASDSDYEDGWTTLRMQILSGVDTFDGYISLLGLASAKSWTLVDSFRYIPPGADEDSCVIYGESTTQPSTTETTAGSTTETTSGPTTETTKIPTETTVEYTTETTSGPTTETTKIPTETTVEYTTETTSGPTTETTKIPIETTTEPTSETTAESATETTTTYTETTGTYATTEASIEVEKCVTYNFESDFDLRFTTDNYLCNGFQPWRLENYTSINLESPNPASNVFMTPLDEASCISTVTIKMEPGGIIEANVFMYEVQPLDHIIIIAQRFTGQAFDTVAGFVKYHPKNDIFVPGWNVIRFSLLDLTSFDGYLVFIGSAEKTSTVLVDSVRYIPPLTPPDDPSCDIY